MHRKVEVLVELLGELSTWVIEDLNSGLRRNAEHEELVAYYVRVLSLAVMVSRIVRIGQWKADEKKKLLGLQWKLDKCLRENSSKCGY